MLNEPSAREEWSDVPREETGRHPWPLLVQNAADGWGAKIARAKREIELMVKKWKTTVRNNNKKTCVCCHYSYIFIADIFCHILHGHCSDVSAVILRFLFVILLKSSHMNIFFPVIFLRSYIYICACILLFARGYLCTGARHLVSDTGARGTIRSARRPFFVLFFCLRSSVFVYSSFWVDPMARYITLSPPLDATEARLYRLLLPW